MTTGRINQVPITSRAATLNRWLSELAGINRFNNISNGVREATAAQASKLTS